MQEIIIISMYLVVVLLQALDCLLQHVVDQLDEIDMTELAMQHQALLTADMDSDTSQVKNTVTHISGK